MRTQAGGSSAGMSAADGSEGVSCGDIASNSWANRTLEGLNASCGGC